MEPNWIGITRRNARSVQTTIGWIFWDPGAVARYEEIGLPGSLGYIAARCAPLAPAGPDAVAAPYQGRYGGRRLWRVAEWLGRVLDGGEDVYAYFNNDWDANAVADATWLRDRLTGRSAARARGRPAPAGTP